MTKKHFIAIADKIKSVNSGECLGVQMFTLSQINAIASVLEEQNPNFKRKLFVDYIFCVADKNGRSLS